MIICVIGPSGSGKTTLVRGTRMLNGFGEIVSSTTREKRLGEINGVDYWFVSEDEFFSAEKLESVCYAGDWHGILKRDAEGALRENENVFSVVTIEGYESLKSFYEGTVEVISIYIDTPIAVLEERMRQRGDLEEKIKRRMRLLSDFRERNNKERCDYVFTNDKDLRTSIYSFCDFVYGIIEDKNRSLEEKMECAKSKNKENVSFFKNETIIIE